MVMERVLAFPGLRVAQKKIDEAPLVSFQNYLRTTRRLETADTFGDESNQLSKTILRPEIVSKKPTFVDTEGMSAAQLLSTL